MIKITKQKMWLAIILAAIIMIPNVYALGITPAREIIDFQPNLEKEVQFKLINSEHKDTKILLYAEGDLSKFITFPEKEIIFSADETDKEVSYILKLPDKMEKLGNIETLIIAREVPKESKEEITITTTLAVSHKLIVRSPYPGKYPQIELHVSEPLVNDIAYFVIPTTNLGTEKIERAKATIEISDIVNGKIASIETNEISLEPKQRKELLGSWYANTNPGFYNVEVILDYDGETIKIEKGLIVKGTFIKILDISAKNFKIGQIAKLNILLENIANKDIKEIETRIILIDNENNNLADIKSSPIDIPSFAKKEAISYLDTEDISKGSYLGKVMVNYEEESLERDIKAEINEDSIRTEIFDTTGRVIGGIPNNEIQKGNSSEKIALFFMVAVIIVNIIIFLKRKNKKTDLAKTEEHSHKRV